jgi:O-Antigen ligase
MPLRRALAEWGMPFGLACMVVAFATGSGWNPRIKHYGLDTRWVVLFVLCGAALVLAARRYWPTRSLPPRGLLRFSALAACFLGVAFLSTAWSVAPRLTFERAVSLAVLFVFGAAISAATYGDTPARTRLFQGLGAGAVAVGLLGFCVVVYDYNAAAIPATTGTPWRYRGWTENPNTIAILAGASLPILVAMAIRAPSTWRRGGWLAGAVVMVVSVIASESRGGLLAAGAGTLIVAVLGVRGPKRQLAAATAVVALFAGGIGLRERVQPPSAPFTSQVAAPTPVAPTTTTPAPTPKPKPKPHGKPKPPPPAPVVPAVKTAELPQEQDEIGHPSLSKQATTTSASGRIAAWEGALEQIGDRPILGYGFGTEQRVFIDRWYYFQGGTTENSYLGLLMQVGAVGLALVLALGCALLIGGFRALRWVEDDERILVVAGLGVVLAAAMIALIQSYLYSVGNIATTTVWVSMFVLSPVALAPRVARARIRAAAPEGVA